MLIAKIVAKIVMIGGGTANYLMSACHARKCCNHHFAVDAARWQERVCDGVSLRVRRADLL